MRARQPCLVHCSAGIGRTGVFAMLREAIVELPKTGSFDVPDAIARFRRSRGGMVQTHEQALYVIETAAAFAQEQAALEAAEASVGTSRV